MAWIVLIVAGLFEVVWASLLESTKGFSRLWPTIGFLGTLGISMFLLSLATRTIPVGTGYAVWVGIGAVGTFAVGVVIQGNETSASQVAAITALVASIVAVKLTAG
jgi:quaternary ammonium compound-resistance protein SugE